MKSKLNIKNFRVFDDKGVIFEMNPITILTGSNSSGKSTAVKAVFLLNSFLAQINKAIENGDPIELDKYKLDFTTYPNNLLGRFDKVVHDFSESRSVTFEYSVYSLMLSKDVNVQLVFSANENDELNNAYLDSITMSTDEGMFYGSSRDKIAYCNLNILKEDYINFLLAEYAAHEYCWAETSYDLEGNLSKSQYEAYQKRCIDFLRDIDGSRRDDILRYVRTAKRKESLIHETEAWAEGLKQLQGKKSIFEIPVVNKLSEMSKQDVKTYVESEFLKDADKAMTFASHKVINGFLESMFDKFSDFFADIEERSLGKSYAFGGTFTRPNDKVHLLKSSELTLAKDYIEFSPYNMDNSISFDENFELIKKDEATQKAEKQKQIEKWENRKLSLDILYEVVMTWNKTFCPNGEEIHKGIYVYHEPLFNAPWDSYIHLSYKLLTMFAEAVVQEVICPDWCGNMSYVSSARASVNRLYTLDNNNDFSLLLQRYFEKKRLYLEYAKGHDFFGKRHYEVDSFMNRWIEKFEIGKTISLKIDKEGLGVQIRLHKAEDDEGRILADEGYGITQLVSIVLQIETAILAAKGEKVNTFFRLECLDKYDEKTFHYEINTIAIEEPEIHLHPKYQSLLADMFLEAYEKYNIHFIIETHSEYLIRKVQVFVAKHQYENEEAMNKENPFKVYYVPRDENPYEMEFCADGRFKNEFGKGFFDEATNLAFEIL